MADRSSLTVKVFRAANRVVNPLLRSCLHPLLSGRVAVIAFRGRRTGHEYQVVASYFPWDYGEILVVSSRWWWTNLRGGGLVRVLIQGRWRHAVPTVVSDTEAKAALLAVFVARKGYKSAKALMLGLPGNRAPTRDELLTAVSKTTFIRLKLPGPTWDS